MESCITQKVVLKFHIQISEYKIGPHKTYGQIVSENKTDG